MSTVLLGVNTVNTQQQARLTDCLLGLTGLNGLLCCTAPQAKDQPISEIVQKATLKKVLLSEQKVGLTGCCCLSTEPALAACAARRNVCTQYTGCCFSHLHSAVQKRCCGPSHNTLSMHKNLQVPILGVAVNKVPARDLAITTSQLKQR